jgi:hypothetical protein
LVGLGAVSAPTADVDQNTTVVSINRINKGDRLSAAVAAKLNTQPAPLSTASTPKRPPLGCDSMFSPIAEPSQARFYRRCAV